MAKSKKNEVTNDWNSISGTMTVFTNKLKGKNGTFLKTSVSIGTKDEEDEYHNYYFDIRFTKSCKDQEPEEAGKHTIKVNNAFFSVDYWVSKKKESVKPVLVVTDCEFID